MYLRLKRQDEFNFYNMMLCIQTYNMNNNSLMIVVAVAVVIAIIRFFMINHKQSKQIPAYATDVSNLPLGLFGFFGRKKKKKEKKVTKPGTTPINTAWKVTNAASKITEANSGQTNSSLEGLNTIPKITTALQGHKKKCKKCFCTLGARTQSDDSSPLGMALTTVINTPFAECVCDSCS